MKDKLINNFIFIYCYLDPSLDFHNIRVSHSLYDDVEICRCLGNPIEAGHNGNRGPALLVHGLAKIGVLHKVLLTKVILTETTNEPEGKKLKALRTWEK